MKIKYLSVLLLLAPILSFGKGKTEYSAYVRNGLLMNHTDLKGYSRITNVKNTLLQSIGGSITRVKHSGFLLSGGIDVGYERYSAKVEYPFKDFGFVPPTTLGNNYTLKAGIPYAEANINIGYRINRPKNAIEFRLGQILHFPLGSKDVSRYNFENSSMGFHDFNFVGHGNFGKIESGAIVGELLNSLYIGIHLPSHWKKVNTWTVGLQAQSKILMNNSFPTYFTMTYFDEFGFIRGKEEFKGRHTSIGLVFGITF